MEKNRTILVNEETYYALVYLKNLGRKRTGKKISFNNVMRRPIVQRSAFLRLEEGLRNYIQLFVDTISAKEKVLGVMLFGSVIKGNYDDYSDIDLLIVTSLKPSDAYEMCDDVINSLESSRKELLTSKGKHMSIAPLVKRPADLANFRTIYFDIVDYGIILFDRNNTLEDFVSSIERLPYKRSLTPKGDVIEWN